MPSYSGQSPGLWGGRSRRLEFILSAVTLIVAPFVLGRLLPAALLAWPLLIVWGLVYSRRLHDLGQSGWWGLLIIFLNFAPAAIVLIPGQDAGAALLARGRTVEAIAAAPLLAILVWSAYAVQICVVLALAILKGQDKPNGYGPPPGWSRARKSADRRAAVGGLHLGAEPPSEA